MKNAFADIMELPLFNSNIRYFEIFPLIEIVNKEVV